MSWPPTSSCPMRDPSCDGSAGQLRSGAGAAAPLVKPTLRGILPHGSEGPWVPIPLRSMGLDDSPCCSTIDVGCVEDKSPFPPENAVYDASTSTLQPIRHCANASCTKLLTPRARSTARRRANSVATALDMPVPAWPRSARTRPSASELTEWRTPCTSARAAASASSASVVAPTATCSCAT